jgi:hypothetical protein
MLNERNMSKEAIKYGNELLGNGFSSIIFNCSQPKYYKIDNNSSKISFNIVNINDKNTKKIKKNNKCFADEDIWLEKRPNKTIDYLLYNYKDDTLQTISSRYLYNLRKVSTFLCYYFFEYLKHPHTQRLKVLEYPPPIECSGRDGKLYWTNIMKKQN